MLLKRKTKENIELKIAAVIAFTVTIIINALANILPINGVTSGEVSDSYPNLFAPIGFTFSIWSVIYLLLIGFCIYQFSRFRNKKSKATEKTLSDILPYFILTSLLNAIWIFSWHFKHIGLSVILIILILICLSRIMNELRALEYKRIDQLLIKTPFSIYYGWVTVATIANITTWLVSTGWNALQISDVFWVSTVLVIGLLIGLIKSERNRDPVFLAVFAWAYFGILSKHIAGSGFNEQYPTVITLLIASIGIIFYKLYTQRSIIRNYFR